jgi:prepilin-type N-terminal cleavage/methylation domain-containing protein
MFNVQCSILPPPTLRPFGANFQFAICNLQFPILSPPTAYRPPSTAYRPPPTAYRTPPTLRRGFTLVELLVVVTIIGILATVVLGGLSIARESAREAKTKATIAKLNEVLLQKYDAYLTRRVPVVTMGMTPNAAATARLLAIHKLMAMEMPDRFSDFNTLTPTTTLSFTGGSMPAPALGLLYAQKYKVGTPPAATHPKYGSVESAKCLYMLVTTGSPDSRELFNANEYADVSGDGWRVFVDGWGQPIKFIREPQAFCNYNFTGATGIPMPSDIQTGNPDPTTGQHDPFDPLNLNAYVPNYQVTPLVYSAGRDKLWGLDPTTGAAVPEGGKSNSHYDNIHNHQTTR